MIYINGEALRTTASKPFITADEWLVGKLVVIGIKEITNITGTYVDSFVQSVIREDEVNFRIVIKDPSTSHSAFQVKIDYVTNTNVAKSETFWLKYNAQSSTAPTINLFAAGGESVNVTTTSNSIDIELNPINISRWVQTKGEFSRAAIDLVGKMMIITIDPSKEKETYRTDSIKIVCYDSKGNYATFYVNLTQNNSEQPNATGSVTASVNGKNITFVSNVKINGTNATLLESQYDSSAVPSWATLHYTDDLNYTYTTEANNTPYIQSAIVPFYFRFQGLNYYIKCDVRIINATSNKAIYLNDSLENNLDYIVNANAGSNIVMTYTLVNVSNTIELVAPNELFNTFDVQIDRNTYTVTFTALFDNETSENDIEFVGLYFRGYDLDGNEVLSPTFTLIQSADASSIQFPLWKQQVIEIKPVDDYVDYRLMTDDLNIIYQGRAYSHGKVVYLSLNELVRPFINQSIDITLQNWQNTNGYGKFKLQKMNENGIYEDYMTIRAFADWSYEDRLVNPQCLQDPIFRTLDYRQKALFSVIDKYGDYSDASITRCWIAKDGVNYSNVINANNEIATIVVHDLSDCDTISCLYTHINSDINIDYEDEYKVECTPYKYCLYYQNLYGGYDSLLLNKTSTESITTKSNSLTSNVSFDSKIHETKMYRRATNRKFKLMTPRLNDEQSAKMCHILQTNQAWLHNLESGEVIPVNIDDSTTQIKTFVSNGRKVITYTFNATEAFTKLRF